MLHGLLWVSQGHSWQQQRGNEVPAIEREKEDVSVCENIQWEYISNEYQETFSTQKGSSTPPSQSQVLGSPAIEGEAKGYSIVSTVPIVTLLVTDEPTVTPGALNQDDS